jgi:predicted DNA-binding ribbon-helix-helix protein
MVKSKRTGFTSLRVDPELWKEVKIEAIRRDMEVSALVDVALRKELGEKLGHGKQK